MQLDKVLATVLATDAHMTVAASRALLVAAPSPWAWLKEGANMPGNTVVIGGKKSIKLTLGKAHVKRVRVHMLDSHSLKSV